MKLNKANLRMASLWMFASMYFYAAIAIAQVTCPVGQFSATYFNNITLSGTPVYSACQSAVNFNWASGGPGNGVTVDNFSARWIGRFAFNAGNYEFTGRTDDGLRVYLNGELIINSWRDQAATTYKATRTVTAGEHEVKVEYYEKGGQAVAQVSWIPVAPTRSLTLRLAWQDMSDNETGFQVHRRIGSGTYGQVATVGVNGQNYNDTIANDPGNVAYCYQVRAYNSTLQSDFSNEACFTSPPIVVVDPIATAPTMTKAVITRCAFNLSATPPDNAGGWTAQFKEGANNVGAPDANIPYSATTELAAGNYSFSVVWNKTGSVPVTSPTAAGVCP